jgi:uncharacterized protein
MLEATFQHIPGVGERTERRLWARGCTSWTRLLDGRFNLPSDTYLRLKAGALESISRLESRDNGYFKERLPSKITWRAYGAFEERACYLDIETTGLSPQYSHITTVCVHGGAGTKNYIHGRNMDELADDLEAYKYIVTFNGARFDLPFLSAKLGLKFPQIHLDLYSPLRSLGYSGGLKSIEKQLGIGRGTEGVDGRDAVYLWHAYRTGKPVTVAGRRVAGEEALDLLVRYNQDDTVNLVRLAEFTVEKMRQKHKADFKCD